ncbi:hypothetical protein [Anaeromicrobium sediminis]|uniref:hypothetical protein n=1 Tax=Anaeromicrobium sediminis TaxID=1478221 RepID=UPI00159562E7|nr:hypothetical protein [Anaeromicrobium sediminis]
MGAHILLRTQSYESPYKHALLELVSIPGEILILSAGFAKDTVFELNKGKSRLIEAI